MLKKLLFIAGILLAPVMFAQQTGQYINKYLIRSDISLVAGNMFKDNIQNVYVNGNEEFYLNKNLSIRGDGNWMVGSKGLTKDSMGLKDYFSLSLGVAYHFPTNGHLDPYCILLPGLAYTSSFHQELQPGVKNDGTKKTNYMGALTPLGSVGLGINYYFQYVAHLFIETRYVYGMHLSEAPKPMSLEEVRITFGLGFNLFVKKDKTRRG